MAEWVDANYDEADYNVLDSQKDHCVAHIVACFWIADEHGEAQEAVGQDQNRDIVVHFLLVLERGWQRFRQAHHHQHTQSWKQEQINLEKRVFFDKKNTCSKNDSSSDEKDGPKQSGYILVFQVNHVVNWSKSVHET